MMDISVDEATFLVNHLFLPPKLPNESDEEKGAAKLLVLFAIAAREYKHQLDPIAQLNWHPIADSIAAWRDVYEEEDSRMIERSIMTMSQHATLLLFLKAQNSAILITKLEISYKFEAWEVSPRQEDVLATKDCLVRQFPALALEISDGVVRHENFVRHLVAQLQTLTTECYVPLSMEHVYKGKVPIEEARQSRHPRLVTEAFFTALASYGQPSATETIQKRMRDEVSFRQAKFPWRRSSVWSCAKVALQLALNKSYPAETDHKHYKSFMVYFLSYIADRLFFLGYSTDHYQVLRTKLARRASKLTSDVPVFVSEAYLATVKRISNAMQKQWNLSRSFEDSQLPLIPVGKYDTDINLPKITPHLRDLLHHATDTSVQQPTHSQPPPSFAFFLDRHSLPAAVIFDFVSTTHATEEVNMANARRRKEVVIVFQQWVAENLDSCLAEIPRSAKVCEQLKSLMEDFWRASRVCFSSYAEIMSGALLTIFELWVALDKMAVELCPLILDYSPEIPKSIFASLLLRKHTEMVRLQKLEDYLEERERNAQYGSLFDDISAKSLSVRLYDRSGKLQRLMAEIERKALDEKCRLRQEFKNLTTQYNETMELDQTREHDYRWLSDGEKVHRRCRKCKDKAVAKNLDIERYEEFLPESTPVRKAIVYELKPDREVVIYRDCLWFVVQDVLQRQTTKMPYALYDLREFKPYKSHADTPGRIGLASVTKPHSKTHRHTVWITTSVDSIFHPHAMRWTLVDLTAKVSVSLGGQTRKTTELSGEHNEQAYSLTHLVHVRLNESPYSKLIDTVHNVGVSQNNVIARQSTCPADLHVSDWCIFGSMRNGPSLQPMNLLRALLSGQLDLTSSATVMLVEQMLHEAGDPTTTSSGVLRIADIDFQKNAYIHSMAEYIANTITFIGDNWKNHLLAQLLVTIAQRVLTLDQNDLLQCVDKTLLPRLFERSTDYAEYVACSIYIHDYSKFFENTDDKWLRLCIERDLFFQIQLERTINQAIKADPKLLIAGVQMVWPLLASGGPLLPCPGVGNRWYQAKHNQHTTTIHLNIATGSLLVNSKPVSILPERYTQSTIYKQVLQDRIVDVVAADDPRMEYMTVKAIEGHQVYFGTPTVTDDTYIHSEKDGLRYAAILRSKFHDDLPPKILEKSRPWLCIHKSTVEFRNKSHPWDSAQSDWNISPVNMNESVYKMESLKSFFMDNRQGVGLAICSILASLEMSKYTHILLDKMKKKLSIELPRCHLNFEIDPHGQIQCNELAAFVRSSQELGTFHGLKNRLVLQAKETRLTNPKLWVLVPFGEVTVKPKGSHVSVTIDNKGDEEVAIFKYRIDKTLHCLVPDQIEGHLWKAYIHVCTSSALPDGLTGCTGLEESFRTLDDCWLRTCVPFSQKAQETLKLISETSVCRSFYPSPDARHMQKAAWNDGMPAMFQHDGLHKKVVDIVNHNKKASFLNTDSAYLDLKYRGNDNNLVLAERAIYAWRKHWPAGLASDENVLCGDKVYVSRDKGIVQIHNSVFEVATTISSWKAPGWIQCDLFELLKERQRRAGSKGSTAPLCFSIPFKPTSLTQLLTIDLNESWPALFRYCLDVREADKAELLFAISMIVFGNRDLLNEVNVLLPFAVLTELKKVGLPSEETYGRLFGECIDWTQYDPCQGDDLDWSIITEIIVQCKLKDSVRVPNSVRQHRLPANMIEQDRAKLNAQRSIIKKAVQAAWPDGQLNLPDEADLDRFDVPLLRKMLLGRLITWKKNGILRGHCKRWQRELVKIGHVERPKKPDVWLSNLGTTKGPRLSGYPALSQAMKGAPSEQMRKVCDKAMGTAFDGCIKDVFYKVDHDGDNRLKQQQLLYRELEELVSTTVGLQDAIKQEYTNSLLRSTNALKALDHQSHHRLVFPDRSFLSKKLQQTRTSMQELLNTLNLQVGPCTAGDKALRLAGLWPEATTPNLLQLISKSHRNEAPVEWRHALIVFARTLCSVQRIERIVRFQETEDHFSFRKEIDNKAHDGGTWILRQQMDWLLFEMQNDLLIRPVQAEVANELIKPCNGVIQLQMGDGKSSVILPLICMSLAAGTANLVRVVVLKSLAKEAMASLSRAFSGLVQTPLYWLPFSRSTPIDGETAKRLRELWKECRASHGVLLTLPEHLNSFRLIGNDQLTAGNSQIAPSLLAAQKFLDKIARDIIDESDEVLKPAYELVYTNGQPRPLSGAPYRWDVLLTTLDVVQSRAKEIHTKYPHGLEYKENEPGVFATVRILTAEAGRALSKAVLQSIVRGALPTLSFVQHDHDTISAFADFVTKMSVKAEVHEKMKSLFREAQEKFAIYLLRGLFAFGLLTATFEKRFFVNYGLDRMRCFSAVPYRAKGCAATAAEFAQPDMMVLLTALSYYYTGLEITDMRQALQIMMRHPDPSDEYSRWVAGSAAPVHLHSVASINMQDEDCVATIHQHLYRTKTVVDFFLQNVVFQKESKQYPFKLSSSAWDLCATDHGKVTGGFSGTMDSYLPDSMPRTDIEGLMHFDAAVLSDLLQSRNRGYVQASDEHGLPLDTMALLRLINKEAPNVSVIIDVGAQTLDKNRDVAQMWLHVHRENRNHATKFAAIFFNEQDEKEVVTIDGNVQSWASSPYKEQVGSCLVYLDQQHCRGTDIVLPDDFAAALLLGPRLPKDSFVQAAMRLRKLAGSQSIITFAPPEVDNSIRQLLEKPGNKLDITDVLLWVKEQSCEVLRGQQIVKARRNLEHVKRSKTFRDQVSNDGRINSLMLYKENILQQEVHEVEHLYNANANSLMCLPKFSKQEKKDQDVIDALNAIELVDKQGCPEQSLDKEQEQEQEREQQHEREAEREIQRPIHAKPYKSSINSWLNQVIMNKQAPRQLPLNWTSAFCLMDQTSLSTDPLWRNFPARLVATKDYLDTVETTTGRDQDDFLRPVEWILKLEFIKELILIGPHEADAWQSELRTSHYTTLIMYAPKTRRDMRSFDKLDVYTIPERADPVQVDPDVLTLLRLFAGQLYFNSFEEYERFCTLLSIRCAPEPEVEGIARGKRRDEMLRLSEKNVKKFDFIPLIKKWINMRRKGVEWSHTDVGRVLNGHVLSAKHFE